MLAVYARFCTQAYRDLFSGVVYTLSDDTVVCCSFFVGYQFGTRINMIEVWFT